MARAGLCTPRAWFASVLHDASSTLGPTAKTSLFRLTPRTQNRTRLLPPKSDGPSSRTSPARLQELTIGQSGTIARLTQRDTSTLKRDNSVLHVVVLERLPNVLERDIAECVRLLIAGGADVHARRLFDPWNVVWRTPFDDALYYHRRWFFPTFLRAGASCPGNPILESYSYFRKVRAAGGIKAYEKAHLKRLVAMLVHKFPQLPAAVHPNIARHWAHVGDY